MTKLISSGQKEVFQHGKIKFFLFNITKYVYCASKL